LIEQQRLAALRKYTMPIVIVSFKCHSFIAGIFPENSSVTSLSPLETCKPGKFPKLNMQTFAPVSLQRKF